MSRSRQSRPDDAMSSESTYASNMSYSVAAPMSTPMMSPPSVPSPVEDASLLMSVPAGPVASQPAWSAPLEPEARMSMPRRRRAAPPAPAPAREEEDEAAVDPERVSGMVARMRTALTGWFTDESEALAVFREASAAERAAIRAEYASRYENGNLDAALADQLEGRDLEELQALDRAEEDPVGAAIATLNNSVGFWNDDEAQIENTLRSLSDAQRQELLERMPASERARIRDALGGEDVEVFDALMEGNRAEAAAIRLDEAMGSSASIFDPTSWFADDQAAADALRSNDGGGEDNAAARAEVVEAFNRRMRDRGAETDFDEQLMDQFDGATRQSVTFTARADDLGARVAGLRASSEVWDGTDEDALFSTLDEVSDTERETFMSRYEELYGEPVDNMLRDELGDLDYERARQLADNGELDPAFAFYYGAEAGFGGTDHEMMRGALEGRSTEEIAAIMRRVDSEYATQYGGEGATHATILREEYGEGGQELHEIEMLMRYGNTDDAEQQLARQREEYAFRRGTGEDGGSNWFSVGMMDLADTVGYSTAAADLDFANQRLESTVGADGSIRDRETLNAVLTQASSENQRFDSERASVTEGAATAAEVTAAALATVLSEGAASPWLVAALGGGAAIGTRAAMLGDAYGSEDMGIDALQVAAQAATAGVTSGIIDPRINEALSGRSEFIQGVARSAAGGALEGITGAATDENALRAGGTDYLGAVLTGAGTGLVGGAASGAASQGVTSALGDAGTNSLLGAAGRSALAGGAGGAASALVDPSILENGINPDELISTILTEAASEAVSGAAEYHVESRRRPAESPEAASTDAETLEAAVAEAASSPEAARSPEALDTTTFPLSSRLSSSRVTRPMSPSHESDSQIEALRPESTTTICPRSSRLSSSPATPRMSPSPGNASPTAVQRRRPRRTTTSLRSSGPSSTPTIPRTSGSRSD